MIFVDVTVFSIALIGTVVVIARRKPLVRANAHVGFATLLAGMWTLVMIYLGDFYTMTVLPHMIGEGDALESMHDLHSGYSWYVNTLALALILFGLVLLVHNLVRQIHTSDKRTQMLEESESLLNSIFENAPVGFLIKDRNHRIERLNKAYQRWYGLNPEILHGVRTDQLEDFQPADDVFVMNQHENEVLTTGKTVNRQVTRRFADDNLHIVSITKFPVHDQHGNITKVGSVSVDMTDQVRAHEATNAALLAAEEANTAKSEFLATMSHEFRTPLNAILGFSEYMCAQFNGPLGNPKYVEYASDIHSSGHHMLALVNDILDISAIEAGKRILDIEAFELLPLLDDCVTNVENQLQRKNIALTLQVENAPLKMSADKRAITQVVLNILSNAAKFTEQHGSIDVSVMSDDKSIRFSITDTGIGISAENLIVITEPFTQSHRNPHLTQQGSGLGLSIVKALVEMHGGSLTIKSTVGEGTSVTFSIPTGLQASSFSTPPRRRRSDLGLDENPPATTPGT